MGRGCARAVDCSNHIGNQPDRGLHVTHRGVRVAEASDDQSTRRDQPGGGQRRRGQRGGDEDAQQRAQGRIKKSLSPCVRVV
jgi:hypothetical protein